MKQWTVWNKDKTGILISFPEWESRDAHEWMKNYAGMIAQPGNDLEGATLELREFESESERETRLLRERVAELEAATSIAPSVTIHGMHHDPSNLYGISPEDWTKCGVYVRALSDRVKELEGVLKTTAEPMRESLARIEELEASCLAVIDERDSYHDWADKLAAAIASHTGDEIGEHSSANNPWANALALIDGQRCR